MQINKTDVFIWMTHEANEDDLWESGKHIKISRRLKWQQANKKPLLLMSRKMKNTSFSNFKNAWLCYFYFPRSKFIFKQKLSKQLCYR